MTSNQSLIEYMLIDDSAGGLFIEILSDGVIRYILGPFDTQEQRQAVLDDMMQMMRELGAIDVENKKLH